MEKKKLWIVSELFYPEETSTGYRMTQIAINLVNDFEIEVISGPAVYGGKDSSCKRYEVYKDIVINRTRNVPFGKEKILSRLFRLLFMSLFLFWKVLVTIPKRSTVLSVTNPALLIIFLYPIIKLKKLKVILVMEDVYPNNVVSAGLMSKGNPVYKIINFVYGKCYDAVTTIVVLGRDMADVVRQKTTAKIDIIENWGQLDIILPKQRTENPILTKNNLLDKVVFLFAGNIGRVQAVEDIVEAINQVKENKELHFVFAGGGALEPHLLEKIKEYDLQNITFLGRYQRKDQIDILNACDIGFVSLSPEMYGIGVPSRSYNLMSAGKPVFYIGDPKSEIDLLLKENKVGWSVTTGNVDEIVKGINLIFKNKHDLEEMGKHARELVENEFSKAHAVAKYKTLLLREMTIA